MSKLVPVAVVTAVILVLSYRPPGMLDFGIEAKVPGGDRVGHAAIYAVLAWLLLRAPVGSGRVRPVLAALLAVMFNAGVIELTQPWVGRTGALYGRNGHGRIASDEKSRQRPRHGLAPPFTRAMPVRASADSAAPSRPVQPFAPGAGPFPG